MTISPAQALKDLGGSAKMADLLRATTRAALRSAHTRGEILRLAHGVYALPNALPMEQVAASLHGIVSHQSAAAYWKMEPLIDSSLVHVTVPKGNRPPFQKKVQLHYADIEDEEVTSPLRTVLDCARSMPFREALAIADSAVRRDLISADELLLAAERLRGPHRRQILRVAHEVDPRSDNAFESALRATVLDAGIAGFQPQLKIPGCRPTIRVDLGDPERKIVLEADSFTFHGTKEALEKDCWRYNELIRRGWLVLRFTWERVQFDPRYVSEMVSGTCALKSTAPQSTAPKKTRLGTAAL